MISQSIKKNSIFNGKVAPQALIGFSSSINWRQPSLTKYFHSIWHSDQDFKRVELKKTSKKLFFILNFEEPRRKYFPPFWTTLKKTILHFKMKNLRRICYPSKRLQNQYDYEIPKEKMFESWNSASPYLLNIITTRNRRICLIMLRKILSFNYVEVGA